MADLGENIVAPLTQRERQILTYIADGNTNKQIANILNISEQTIKNHVSAILRKLNANDRAHAVVLAIRRGLIRLNEGAR
jgi:DNA-binding NarL/FixJ family response regulator